ncbi:MAG: general secretion pathway protein GspK [Thermodesulfovibrionales bacterium]
MKTERGVALLLVLWVLTVLMVIVFAFSFSTRVETHSVLSFKDGMEKRFIAQAGIERGIVEIFYNKRFFSIPEKESWRMNGTPYTGEFGGGYYEVKIMDEFGKVDINTAPDVLLKNLLIQLGLKNEESDAIVDAIMDWKDADDLRRLNGAESDYYMTLPNPYRAKNSNFDSVEELIFVKGITHELLYGGKDKKGLVEFVTVHSKSPQVSINSAPREVLLAVPGITQEIADNIISYRKDKRITNPSEVGVPMDSNQYLSYIDSNTFTIDSTGFKGAGNGGYTIRATVSLEGENYRYVYYKSPLWIEYGRSNTED